MNRDDRNDGGRAWWKEETEQKTAVTKSVFLGDAATLFAYRYSSEYTRAYPFIDVFVSRSLWYIFLRRQTKMFFPETLRFLYKVNTSNIYLSFYFVNFVFG